MEQPKESIKNQDVRIVSWNVNSINARLNNVLRFVKEQKPHIIMFQELKCVTTSFPYQPFEDMQYNVVALGQKAYNGVAIASLSPIEDVFTELIDYQSIRGLDCTQRQKESRYIECCTEVNGLFFRIACVYVPNGCSLSSNMQYKLEFLEILRQRMLYVSQFDELFILGGDMNIAPEIYDVFDHNELQNSVCFTLQEREKLREILDTTKMLDGWRLLNLNAKDEFTWWDYRGHGLAHNHGMRLDHFILSPQAADRMYYATIHKNTRMWEKASDHAPVEIVLRALC